MFTAVMSVWVKQPLFFTTVGQEADEGQKKKCPHLCSTGLGSCEDHYEAYGRLSQPPLMQCDGLSEEVDEVNLWIVW